MAQTPLNPLDLFDAAAVLRRTTTTADDRTFDPCQADRHVLATALEQHARTGFGYKPALRKVMRLLDQHGPEQDHESERLKYAFMREELAQLCDWIEDDSDECQHDGCVLFPGHLGVHQGR